jgi:hypothetical protein
MFPRCEWGKSDENEEETQGLADRVLSSNRSLGLLIGYQCTAERDKPEVPQIYSISSFCIEFNVPFSA